MQENAFFAKLSIVVKEKYFKYTNYIECLPASPVINPIENMFFIVKETYSSFGKK